MKLQTLTQQMRKQLSQPYYKWGFSYKRTKDAVMVEPVAWKINRN